MSKASAVALVLRNENDGRNEEFSVLTGVENHEPDLTQQQWKDECDIQVLAARFGLTGEFPQPKGLAEYGDFTGVTDLHTALNELRQAQENFDNLPVKIRARFENDPAKLWDFLHGGDENVNEAVDLGILRESARISSPVAAGEANGDEVVS